MSDKCMYPQFRESSSYHKGCRCFRCRSYHVKYMKEWRQKNKNLCQDYEKLEKRRNAANARKASRRQKMKVSLSVQERKNIQYIYDRCRKITEETGILHHVDHIVPLCRGGLHHPSNLQILTAEANLKKGIF